nr:hypothetical protein BaRGS_029773 [Batillaria attramentaria]
MVHLEFSHSIGYYTALDLAARNARVILACRSKTRGEAAREKIIARSGNKDVVVRVLNLGSLESVRQFARDVIQTEERLDILVNNAGANGLPQITTDDGLELNFAVNHFGPFLLTNMLLDLMAL